MTIGFRADATGNGILQVNGTDRLQIGTAGQLGIGGATYGTAGQVLTSNGPSAPPSWNPGATVDTQTFNSSGTWTKPSTGNFVRIQMWGGGGGGGRASNAGWAGGGGGGGYNEYVVPLSWLASSVSITVGGGGAGATGNGSGAAGGITSVPVADGPNGARTVYVGGGAGGGNGINGGPGGRPSATNVNFYAPSTPDSPGYGAGSCDGAVNGDNNTGGGGANNNFVVAGSGIWGGGGGTTGSNTVSTSQFGGGGGNFSTPAVQPGGGGGCSTAANVNGMAGAAGRVIITTY
jgi:hypothetical protein